MYGNFLKLFGSRNTGFVKTTYVWVGLILLILPTYSKLINKNDYVVLAYNDYDYVSTCHRGAISIITILFFKELNREFILKYHIW